MADVHRRAAPNAPRLTAEEIASRGFQASFRGISEPEVRTFLRRVADENAAARAHEDDLNEKINELQEQVKNPPIVTEERLLDALGEETARVLRSAQEAAVEIRASAEAKAATVIADAEQAATTAREEADSDARAMRDTAQSAAAAREAEATTFAAELRAEVEAEVAELRATTDAELTAAREASMEASASEIDAAKEAGRDLVNEARAVRERILADLGRRRLLLQSQIDELRAGRDRLLDAYRVVKRTLGDATEALVQVETRAADELSGPPSSLEVPPVDGELAALAGELTGEAGAPSVEVEALFARLREQNPAPAPIPEPKPAVLHSPAPEPPPRPTKPKSAYEQRQQAAVIDIPEAEVPQSGTPEPERSGGEPRGNVPSKTDLSETERTSNEEDSERTSHLDTRASVLDPLARELGRKVKRALQDDQSSVLDRIRTVKGRPEASEVLPSAESQIAQLAATLRGPVDAAYAGGRRAAGKTGGSTTAPAAMVDGLAATMVERLHARLVEAIDDAGDDEIAVTQRLGARYREFKGQDLDAVVGDALAAAWALGVYDATPAGRTLRWIPSVEGNCPDCDDNALEPTARGKQFPTGQPYPPAHPGCRCLVVPLPI